MVFSLMVWIIRWVEIVYIEEGKIVGSLVYCGYGMGCWNILSEG